MFRMEIAIDLLLCSEIALALDGPQVRRLHEPPPQNYVFLSDKLHHKYPENFSKCQGLKLLSHGPVNAPNG